MKNYEKYADEIREYEGNNFCKDFIAPYILKSNKCNLNDCGMCNMLQMIWLFEEYKEPEVDWSKVEVDTPILVRDSEDDHWCEAHFAEYKDGEVFVWDDGKTSWTTRFVAVWKFAKLAETRDEK